MINRTILARVFLGLLTSFWVLQAPAAEHERRPAFTGKVTDEVGEPIAEARVDISTAAPKAGRAIFCPSCYLDCKKFATTNDRGEFRIADLDPTLKFRLVASSPKFATAQTELLDPAAGPIDIRLSPFPEDVDPNRIVAGVVRNEHGIAIPGALVSPFGATTAKRRWWGRVEGVDSVATNADGEFSLVVPENFSALDVEITADGTCGKRVYGMKPGAETQSIEAPTGASVVGRLTRNGSPVEGMSIAVAQTDRRIGQGSGIFIRAVNAITNSDGEFRFDNLPPDQQYCIYSVAGDAKRTESEQVLKTKTFQVPASEQVRDVGTLEVAESLSVSGRVENAEGEPLPEDLKIIFGREPAWDLLAFPIAEDGSFKADGIPPETYEIKVSSREFVLVPEETEYPILSERSLALYAMESIQDLVVTIKKRQSAEAGVSSGAVPFGQGLSGVVVSRDGKPLPGIRIDASDSMASLPRSGPPPWTETDSQGRFALTNLPEKPVWLKVYHPAPAGRFIFKSMVQPELNADDVRIVVDRRLWSGIEDLDAK